MAERTSLQQLAVHGRQAGRQQAGAESVKRKGGCAIGRTETACTKKGSKTGILYGVTSDQFFQSSGIDMASAE